jgi:hypothetical protein
MLTVLPVKIVLMEAAVLVVARMKTMVALTASLRIHKFLHTRIC